MKMRQLIYTAIAAAVVCLAPVTSHAQTIIRGTSYNFGLPAYFPIYGGYGAQDSTIAVTPYGIQPIGQGYNGYTGMGLDYNPDWQILNQAYQQGYQAAMNQAMAGSAAEPGEVSYPSGMTATPRGVVGRVPHGSDGVRAWRIGRSQVALRWQGDARIASSVTFELADRSGRTLRRTTLDQLPAEIHFTPPAEAYYYVAKVRYIDGASNTIMSRLPR